jgi:hypothetical protein
MVKKDYLNRGSTYISRKLNMSLLKVCLGVAQVIIRISDLGILCTVISHKSVYVYRKNIENKKNLHFKMELRVYVEHRIEKT